MSTVKTKPILEKTLAHNILEEDEFIDIRVLNLITGYGAFLPTLYLYYFGLGWVAAIDLWMKISPVVLV